jgi:phage head maturation protease
MRRRLWALPLRDFAGLSMRRLMKKREREMKTMPAWTKGVDGRKVTGITAVMGNVDDGGDRIIQGAFKKTLAESSRRIRHLWQHGADGWDYGVTPPIAAITRIQEVGRDALPEEVRKAEPLATGGLEVEREYLQTPRGEEILAAYKAGVSLEMSIGYEAIIKKWIEDDKDRVSFGHYRDLIELRLFDTSDVNWGMNSATVGSKNLARRFQLLVERLKSLDFHELMAAELDSSLLEEFRALCALYSGLKARPEMQQQQAKQQEQQEPSRAGEPRSSLTPQLIELQQLELAMFS